MMTVLRNRGQWDASNIEFTSGAIIRYDKRAATTAMEHIDYGLSLFSAAIFVPSPESSAFDLSEVQQSLIAQRAMAAFEVKDRFYEIGSLSGLQQTDHFLRTSAAARLMPLRAVFLATVGWGVRVVLAAFSRMMWPTAVLEAGTV